MKDAPSTIRSVTSRHPSQTTTHESLGFRHEHILDSSLLPPSPTLREGVEESSNQAYDEPVASKDQQPNTIGPKSEPLREPNVLSRHFMLASSPVGQTGDDSTLSAQDLNTQPNTTMILGRVATAHHPHTKYSVVIPVNVGHKYYHEYLPMTENNPEKRFTQVLIWCILRRIEHLAEKWGGDKPLSSTQLQIRGALKHMGTLIATEQLPVNWIEDAHSGENKHSHDYYQDQHERSRLHTQLSPRPNPENAINESRLRLAEKMRDHLMATAEQWVRTRNDLEAKHREIISQGVKPGSLEKTVNASTFNYRDRYDAAVQKLSAALVHIDGVNKNASRTLSSASDMGSIKPLSKLFEEV